MPGHFLTPFLALTLMSSHAGLPAMAQPSELAARLSASTIVAISDGDFVGQTYATGRLAPREAGHRDLLTVLSVADGRVRSASLPVSNSVTATPESLALTPDGRTAFVIERLGARPANGETIADLPPGNKLFAADLADPTKPRLADVVEIAEFPEGLAASPDGGMVAVVSNTAQASFVQLVAYRDGRFDDPVRIDLADVGVRGSADAPRGGVTATNVQWHPSGRFLAVNINTQDRVAFFELVDDGGKPGLRPWGNIVETGADPFVGRFTPDGGYYLTSDWGRNFSATDLTGRLPDRPSAVSVIRLADPSRPTGQARHERIASVPTDASAEGLAVSPDGRFVATINMRGTAFPPSSDRFNRHGTVSLLAFDPATGSLAKAGDYPFEGVLPEGGTFDLTGDHFLATVFQGHDDAPADLGAGLEVFRVVKAGHPALERLGRIPLPHGVHHVAVAGR